jgi:pilus assembly protein Flp/PilA
MKPLYFARFEMIRTVATRRRFVPFPAAQGIKERVRRFLVSEDGPTAVEYAVMLALIIIVCVGAISLVGTKASSTFTYSADSLPC